ncbi:MAG TPA: hypothetical protein PKY59_16865 [Pyrinomonadaceae bacterium]|nr:hypothetical protein [Pyrinomonadaceae bacterium]
MSKKLQILLLFSLVFYLSCVSIFGQEKEIPINDPDRIQATSFKQVKLYLDDLSKNWKLNSDKEIYIVCYGKLTSNQSKLSERESLKTLSKSKEYLNLKHKIPAEKIHTIYAGIMSPDMELMIYLIEKEEFEKLSNLN